MTFINALYNLWPAGDRRIPGLRDAMATQAPQLFPVYGITTVIALAQFMAQISLECGAGMEVEENLNYSPARLPQVWPAHFNAHNAISYAHNPQKLANYIYEPPIHNDLGNKPRSNDGWTYRGRGATQTTGREGYQNLQKYLADKRGIALDLIGQPDLVNDPRYFLECGLADFTICGCVPFAIADDIKDVTRHLNGGLIDFDQRVQWLARWKTALRGIFMPLPVLRLPDTQPVVPMS